MKREESRNFDMFFMFGREEKCVENVQAETKQPRSSLFFGLEGAWGLL